MSLVAEAAIQTPTGWLELLETAGYELHSEFRNQRPTSHRKLAVENEWVEGSYTIRSVRENTNELVAVYVRGESHFDLWSKVEALTAAFDQLTYQMRVRYGDNEETWSCQTADYQIDSSKEFSHAQMALIKATVPRLPTMTRTQVLT